MFTLDIWTFLLDFLLQLHQKSSLFCIAIDKNEKNLYKKNWVNTEYINTIVCQVHASLEDFSTPLVPFVPKMVWLSDCLYTRQQLDIPRLIFCTYQYCVWPLEGDVAGVQLSGNYGGRQPGCYLLVAGLHRAQKAQTGSGAAAGAAVHPARGERCERWDAQGLAEHQLPVMVDLHHLCAGVWEARGREKQGQWQWTRERQIRNWG